MERNTRNSYEVADFGGKGGENAPSFGG